MKEASLVGMNATVEHEDIGGLHGRMDSKC